MVRLRALDILEERRSLFYLYTEKWRAKKGERTLPLENELRRQGVPNLTQRLGK